MADGCAPVSDRFYKPNLDETLGRLRAFWNRRMTRGITLNVRGFANPYHERYLDSRAFEPAGTRAADVPSDELRWDRWDAQLGIHRQLHDDSLPVAYPTLDFGESLITALVGGEIQLFWRGDGSTYSALVEPIVRSAADVDGLRFDPATAIARRTGEVTAAMQSRARGRFGVCPFITMDALNFACEVMGTTEAYMAVARGGTPAVHRLMDFAVDLNVRFLEMQQALIDDFAGGAFHHQAHWVPFEGATPWLSVDSYTCCSPRTYAEVGRAYQQRLIDHFGQGVMHFHTSRIDLLLEVAKLDGLLGLSIDGSGRAQDPTPFEVLMEHGAEIRRIAGDLPLMCRCTEAEFVRHMEDRTLPGNVRYSVTAVETVAEANALVERAKDYVSCP